MVVILVVAVSAKSILLIVPWMTWYFLVGVNLLNVGYRLLVVDRRVAAAAVAGNLRQGGRRVGLLNWERQCLSQRMKGG